MPDTEIDKISQESSKNEGLLFIWETIKVIVISLVIIIPIRYYLVQPFFVKGGSMEPGFNNGNYLLVDEISYRFKQPERGEVIVFHYPYDTSQFYIKRIIGLPGETVEVRNDEVRIYNAEHKDGVILEEKYLSPGQRTLGDTVIRLGGNEYFVMGDNRLQSSDSRRWGSLEEKFITGKAFLRLWPLNKITVVPEVGYNNL